MTDPSSGPLLLTGASGTVGTVLLAELARTWPGELLAIGRTPPPQARPRRARFTAVDLSDTSAVTALATQVASGPPVGALVCAAGLDSRASLGQFTQASAAECMQVNAWAHVELLRAALASRTPNPAATPPATLPVVLISSDVVGAVMPGTLVYAAAKAAAEEAFRHAAADSAFGPTTEPESTTASDEPSPTGIGLLIVQLPDIGIPMRAAAPGPPPPPRDGYAPRKTLNIAVDEIITFLAPSQPPSMELCNA